MGGVFLFYILKKLIIGNTKSFIHGKEIAYVDPSSGTPYTRDQIWKAATAALYGLGPDSVPDDGFAYLGKYAQHWWRRRTPGSSAYKEHKKSLTDRKLIGESDVTLQYSKNITISSDGLITLNSPSSVTFSYNEDPVNDMQTLCNAAPIYIHPEGGSGIDVGVYYLPLGSTFYAEDWVEGPYTMSGWANNRTGVTRVYLNTSVSESIKALSVTAELQVIPPSSWEYLQSSSRHAYPDSGEQDGYEYQYLGIPFDNIINNIACKIAVGSYIGTGEYGPSNPNKLTFEFEPKLILIVPTSTTGTYSSHLGVYIQGVKYVSTIFNGSGGSGASVNNVTGWGTKTISWSNYSYASDQLNDSGYTYCYIALS